MAYSITPEGIEYLIKLGRLPSWEFKFKQKAEFNVLNALWWDEGLLSGLFGNTEADRQYFEEKLSAVDRLKRQGYVEEVD